jgi:hypothetical protein
VLLSNLGLSLGLSGRTDEGIAILRELAHDGAATANTRGNLALVYGLAGQEREASAVLATDLAPAQVQNNLAYYRELRGLMARGKPISVAAPAPSSAPAARVAEAEPAAAAQGAAAAPAAASASAAAPAEPQQPKQVAEALADPAEGFVPAAGGKPPLAKAAEAPEPIAPPAMPSNPQ